MKKPWEKPQLVMLVRGKPEESIWDNCRNDSGGPTDAAYACHQGAIACTSCVSWVDS